MSLIQTTPYSLYTKNAFEGQEAYASEGSIVISKANEGTDLTFGKAVKAGTKPESIVAGSVAGNVFAIAMRELNHQSNSYPNSFNPAGFNGGSSYNEKDTVSCFRQGTINLVVTQRAAVAGELANVNETSGEFAGGAAGAGESACTNVTWLEAGLVGDIIKARIDIKHS